MNYTATYSPDDNKLRLYAGGRLPADVYAQVKAAGFSWAPKQELFVAPMWTPARESLLLELCGEIGDEDTSLADRAEQRAKRFEDYSDNRAADAEGARKAVAAIADNIPLGQPILVGHHSEKHARKDAERIENGMRRAVKMWETSKYWEQRAAGAIRHAKYKERSDVRTRRIQRLEADKRKQERTRAAAESALKVWSTLHETTSLKHKDGTPTTFQERAEFIAGNTNTTPYGVWSDLKAGKITPEQAQEIALKNARGSIAWADRWIQHYGNRLAYERAMLADAGGTIAQQNGPEKGGACKCWASPRGGWSTIQKVNKVSVTVLDNWGNGGKDFTRTIEFDKLAAIMSKAEVDAARAAGRLVNETAQGFGLLAGPPVPPKSKEDRVCPDGPSCPDTTCQAERKAQGLDVAAFEGMRESLRAGVQVVSAPQLFPTPRELAQRVADLADVQPGHRVLEPSAGLGALLGAMGGRMFAESPGLPPYKERGQVHAIEINRSLAGRLQAEFPLTEVHCHDFLENVPDDFDPFDRIVMNPPFANGADIKHIQHALKFLKPGGRLVAICANGSRQRDKLQPLASEWHELPPDTFKESGTGVNTVLLVVDL